MQVVNIKLQRKVPDTQCEEPLSMARTEVPLGRCCIRCPTLPGTMLKVVFKVSLEHDMSFSRNSFNQ
jgi:hypothetical protein